MGGGYYFQFSKRWFSLKKCYFYLFWQKKILKGGVVVENEFEDVQALKDETT